MRRKKAIENQADIRNVSAFAHTRVIYAAVALISFAAIVYIALFVTQPFVRGHLGDVLVVIPIHCAIRVVFPHKPRLLPLYVFLSACLVELTQAINLLELLGLAHITWLRIVVGVTFDWLDILWYAVGCALMFGLDILMRKRRNHHLLNEETI
ncbi:MAG: DUF2809 domain-containing protein [Oscillospiraceae bacterium]|nr:DUF2809 domain-containing protein [Oscillospiraceae bacterium]